MKMTLKSLVCGGVVGCLFLAGCARDTYLAAGQRAVSTPELPRIFATPSLYLLTNNSGFVANVRSEGARGTSTGRIYGDGPRLFYTPAENQRDTKYGPAGRFSFIWDATKNSGVVLSEALQGYAPISLMGAGPATNLVVEPSGRGRTVTADFENGTRVQFEASGYSREGVPERITGTAPAFTATFDKVVSEKPPPELFKVPEGFTAYRSPEAMVDELALRFRNLKKNY